MGVVVRFTVTFKAPDALEEAIETEMQNIDICFESILPRDRLEFNDSEKEVIEEEQREVSESMRRVGQKFLKYGEYVTIELDTDTMTATVKEAKDSW